MSQAPETYANAAWRSLYPFEPNFFEVGGQRLHYVHQGNGKPVLFVHGNPTWSFYYRNLIQHLKKQFRTIAVDHIGCGLSDKPFQYPFCLEQHIENLTALVNELDLNDVTLVAHDWGGAIGLGTVLRQPNRFDSIVLFNTGGFPPPYIPQRIAFCRWPVFGKIAVQGFNAFARAAVTMATEQRGGLKKLVADGLLAPYDSWNHRAAIYGFVKDIPMSEDHPTYQTLVDIENGLDSIKHWPIQLIWGMKDWCFRPECLDRFKSHWPDASVMEIADAGHYVVEDAPQKICRQLTQFLGGL